MRRALRKLTARHDIGLVVVDYLQLVETLRRKRAQPLRTDQRDFPGHETVGARVQSTLVVLAQLNRESEKEGRRPRLSDLRDSGSIEQDADIILMPSLQNRQDEQADTLAIHLIIAKQRNGPGA